MRQSGFPPVTGERLSAIGDKGELWLAARLPSGWIWQPPRKDVGKDGLVVIRDDSDLHNLEFAIQVKTATNPRISNGHICIRNVSRSSVLYWLASSHPTLVVLVSMSGDCAWYEWHFNLVGSPTDLPGEDRKTLQLRIPSKNLLTHHSWDDIRAELRRCYNYLYSSMAKADSFVWLVASIGSVCNAARNLLKISETPLPAPPVGDDDGVLLLIEQQQHRNILVVAHKFRRALDPESALYGEVDAWIAQYEPAVRSAFLSLGEVPSEIRNDFGQELCFLPGKLNAVRRELIMMLFDFVALLARIHPSGSHTARPSSYAGPVSAA
jgi:Domain of unknown function (DUF4365)